MNDPIERDELLTEEQLTEEQLSGLEAELTFAERRALRELAGEMGSEPPPELDWKRVETGLFARIDADRRDELAARRRRLTVGLSIAAAAAAVIVLAFSGLFDSRPTAPSAGLETATTDLSQLAQDEDGYAVSALAPKSAVESGAVPVTFTLPGVVTWTLAPDSRVIVDAVSVPHQVTLERGRIDAEVVPRKPGDAVEAFVVTAGSARVAVRGTVFSVAREETVVTVEVTRGKVAVGPTGSDAVELLVGPARARFSLDGSRRLARSTDSEPSSDEPSPIEPPRADESAAGTEAPGHGAATSPVPPAAHEEEPAAEPPPPSPAEPSGVARISVDQARSMVLGCLRQALARDGGGDRAVTVSSAVTVTLGPEGRVDAVRFSPPLRPDLQQRCGGALFGQSLTADGKARFDVQVTR